MQDGYGRAFHYLRLSVTDVCNFRCVYCLPNGYHKTLDDPLSVQEIRLLVQAFADLGLWKVRITGGEPTTRRDLPAIVEAVREVPGVRHVALSTNGYKLPVLPVDSVNVSVDSLDRATFARMTGRDVLPHVLDTVDALLAQNKKVKLNAVLMGEPEEAFFAYVKTRPVTVRFIQLMQTGDNELVFLQKRAPLQPLLTRLQEWTPCARSEGDGPAIEYSHPAYAGRIGVIGAYQPGFCDTCNRLRVTSTGKLRLCLFGDGETDLRPLLHDRARLQQTVLQVLQHKQAGHFLHSGNTGITRHLAETGG